MRRVERRNLEIKRKTATHEKERSGTREQKCLVEGPLREEAPTGGRYDASKEDLIRGDDEHGVLSLWQVAHRLCKDESATVVAETQRRVQTEPKRGHLLVREPLRRRGLVHLRHESLQPQLPLASERTNLVFADSDPYHCDVQVVLVRMRGIGRRAQAIEKKLQLIRAAVVVWGQNV